MTTERRFQKSSLLIPGVGLLFAVLFAAQNLYRGAILGSPTTWSEVLSNTLPRFLAYSLLAPLVGWLVDRAPIRGPRAWAPLGWQLLGGIAFSFAHSAMIAGYFGLFRLYPPDETLLGAFRRLSLVYFGMDLIIFCAISGAYHAQRYVREVRKRDQQAAALRAQLSEARLEALRAQLNPHFLFNTLNATSALAMSGEREQVVATLGALGQLLRVSLDPALPQRVPLQREMEILAAYVEIQRVRFGERLSIDLDISPDTLDLAVPSMVLQPLVENALQHGIGTHPGPGRVTIRADRAGDRLRLRIEDTGPGFTGSAPTGHGIGLGNTRERLFQLYGAAGDITCGTLPAGGGYVEITLPATTVES